MITSASLLYKRPAGTVGCLNLSRVRKVTLREMSVITAWIKDMAENADVDDTQVMDFLNQATNNNILAISNDYYLEKAGQWVYVQGVNRDPYIQVTNCETIM